MWFIDVEVEQETSAPRPKKNPGSPPDYSFVFETTVAFSLRPINNTDKPMLADLFLLSSTRSSSGMFSRC